MKSSVEFDKLVETIAEKILRRAGCSSCPAAGGGGGRNCHGSPEESQWLNDAQRVVDAIVAAGAHRISTRCKIAESRSDLAQMIDHTLLKPDATREDFQRLCEEAARFRFWSVCVHPAYVGFCKTLLSGTTVRVCTVIGFPHGCNVPEVKALEAEIAQRDGATELDMVMNVGALKSKEREYVEADIRAVVGVRRPGNVVKVILETSQLSDEEIVVGCELSRKAGADFVKTSTGFASGGATATAVALMRRVVGAEMGVKASGGVRDVSRAELLIRAGADRIGASASVSIVGGQGSEARGY